MSNSWSPRARCRRTQAYKLLEHTLPASSRAFPEERERLQAIVAAADAGTITTPQAVTLFEDFMTGLRKYQ